MSKAPVIKGGSGDKLYTKIEYKFDTKKTYTIPFPENTNSFIIALKANGQSDNFGITTMCYLNSGENISVSYMTSNCRMGSYFDRTPQNILVEGNQIKIKITSTNGNEQLNYNSIYVFYFW